LVALSGGAMEAVADECGGENLRLVVFDSHFDFIPPSIRCGLIQYDVETNRFLKHVFCVHVLVRSVGSLLGPSCSPAVRRSRSVQVLIPHKPPGGIRTHGKRLAAQAQTTQEYCQRGEPVPAVVCATGIAAAHRHLLRSTAPLYYQKTYFYIHFLVAVANPETKFTPNEPCIFNRQDSYNADSFLNFILKKVPPENVFVVGVSDYPPKTAREIEDDRVKRYLEYYKGIEASGVHLIRKEDIRSDSARVKLTLSKTDKPFTYISVDVDVCANTSLRGARFLDYHGLSHSGLYGLASALGGSLKSSRLVGIDFMEFDIYNAGALISGKADRTYQIMAEVFRRIMVPHHTRQ